MKTLLLAVLLPCAALAQTPTFDATTRKSVIDSLKVQLIRRYVSEDTAHMIAAVLQRELAAGSYDTLRTPARFAEVVTRHMRSINDDRHLGLSYSPAPPSAPAGGAPAPNSAARTNWGLSKLEVLPGNIGYLEIIGFQGAPGYDEATARAMRFLEHTDAIIIDVRRNGGGSSAYSHLLFSYFLNEKPVETIKVVQRGGTNVRSSVAHVAGPRRETVPLYVLTSPGTASAAEEFSFVLKNRKRATLVGERTAGAGHMVGSFGLGHGFSGSVSLTRVLDPVSGLEWETVGVQPDLRVAPEAALEAAHAHALRTVAQARSGLDAKTLLLLAEASEARTKPVAVTDLQKLAGEYDEGRSVEYRDGKLWLRRRAGVMPDELVPLASGNFAAGAQRIRFITERGRTVLSIERADGVTLSYAKLR